MGSYPTLTLDEVSKGIQDPTTSTSSKKVLEGLLNDHMDLLYEKETPYTTGQQILPSGTVIDDVKKSIADDCTELKVKDVFKVIAETYKNGGTTQKAVNDGTWNPKFTPVLVLVKKND